MSDKQDHENNQLSNYHPGYLGPTLSELEDPTPSPGTRCQAEPGNGCGDLGQVLGGKSHSG